MYHSRDIVVCFSQSIDVQAADFFLGHTTCYLEGQVQTGLSDWPSDKDHEVVMSFTSRECLYRGIIIHHNHWRWHTVALLPPLQR